MTYSIDIVFDGAPGPTGGTFVEVENDLGHSIKLGEWFQRSDGYWVLRFTAKDLRRVGLRFPSTTHDWDMMKPVGPGDHGPASDW